MKNEQIIFINQIRPVVEKYAKKYGYNVNVVDAIVGQACLESNYGKSELSAKYHNYFGMKCGGSWKGASVNMTTKEEYTVGTLTTIKDNFRAYESMEAGVAGYFDFISYSRYANLKTATDAKDYLEKIKADGYATSSTYVDVVYNIWKVNNLGAYDKSVATSVSGSSELESALKVIAKNVIAGKFGVGRARKENIYKAVQEQVNKLV